MYNYSLQRVPELLTILRSFFYHYYPKWNTLKSSTRVYSALSLVFSLLCDLSSICTKMLTIPSFIPFQFSAAFYKLIISSFFLFVYFLEKGKKEVRKPLVTHAEGKFSHHFFIFSFSYIQTFYIF